MCSQKYHLESCPGPVNSAYERRPCLNPDLNEREHWTSLKPVKWCEEAHESGRACQGEDLDCIVEEEEPMMFPCLLCVMEARRRLRGGPRHRR